MRETKKKKFVKVIKTFQPTKVSKNGIIVLKLAFPLTLRGCM